MCSSAQRSLPRHPRQASRHRSQGGRSVACSSITRRATAQRCAHCRDARRRLRARAAFLCPHATCLSAVCRPLAVRGQRWGDERAPRAAGVFLASPYPVLSPPAPLLLAQAVQAGQPARQPLLVIRHRARPITGQRCTMPFANVPSPRYSWPSNDHGSPDLHDNSVATQSPPHLPTMLSVPASSHRPQPDTRLCVQNFLTCPERPKRSRAKSAQTLHACYSSNYVHHESV